MQQSMEKMLIKPTFPIIEALVKAHAAHFNTPSLYKSVPPIEDICRLLRRVYNNKLVPSQETMDAANQVLKAVSQPAKRHATLIRRLTRVAATGAYMERKQRVDENEAEEDEDGESAPEYEIIPQSTPDIDYEATLEAEHDITTLESAPEPSTPQTPTPEPITQAQEIPTQETEPIQEPTLQTNPTEKTIKKRRGKNTIPDEPIPIEPTLVRKRKGKETVPPTPIPEPTHFKSRATEPPESNPASVPTETEKEQSKSRTRRAKKT